MSGNTNVFKQKLIYSIMFHQNILVFVKKNR